MTDTFVVIGGDAAGMSAASKAKRDDPDLEVVVFEQGDWVSYGACGLPYYVKGEVDTLSDLVAVEPERFVEERGIDLRRNHEVTAIDTASKTVTVEAEGETFEQPYDHLLVATGARAIEPPIEGIDLPGVFAMHDMAEARELRDVVAGGPAVEGDGYGAEATQYTTTPETVGIVGGGYIGVEMAEAFQSRGLDVHLFEMLPHILQPFGETVAEEAQDHLREQGVTLHLDTPVERLAGDDRVTAVETPGGSVPVDLVLVGAGVAPNSELAEAAGIELGPTSAIRTDEYGRTSATDVYAAGDCAEATNLVTGEPDHVPLALTANRHGRAIGQTVAGDPTPVGGIVGTAVAKVFDLAVARTGVVDADEAREHGFDPAWVTIQAPSRAHYYPGGSPITVRMMADRESGRLLGASMVGAEGVAKRIDTVATALQGEMTVDEVQTLDLSYAPPFSPVWDPVLTAAKVLSGKLERAPPVEAD